MSRWPIASPAWWPIWSTLPAACWWVPSTRAPTACARQRKTCARRSAWPKAVPLIAPPAPTAAGRDARAALAVADYGYVLEMGEFSLHGRAADLAEDPRVIDTYLGVGGARAAAA